MRKLLIISNRLAGDGRSQPLLDEARILDGEFERILVNAGSDRALKDAIRGARPSDTAAIVIFGGDGTVHRCLELLVQAEIPVAVFPAGTVNDLALELGMTAHWRDLAEAVSQGRQSAMRLLEVNGRPLAVYGTLGLGAETSRRQQRVRARLKGLRLASPTIQAPLLALFTVFTAGHSRKLRLSWNGKTRDCLTAGIYVVNQRRVNRTIDLEWDKVAGPAQFRMIVFKEMGRLRLLRTVIRLSTKRRLSAIRDSVDVFDVDRMEIESLDGSPISFFGDGEPMVEADRLRIQPSAQPLLVYRGRSA
jgi:diacylglycerol kinase family enzyme